MNLTKLNKKTLETGLLNHPGQLVTIDLENSLFQDDVFSVEYSQECGHSQYWGLISEHTIQQDLEQKNSIRVFSSGFERNTLVRELVRLLTTIDQEKTFRYKPGKDELAAWLSKQSLIQTLEDCLEKTKLAAHILKLFTLKQDGNWIAHALIPAACAKEYWTNKRGEPGELEEIFIERLLEDNTLIEDNQMQIQEYESVHEIHPGKRFVLRDGSYELSYVPHYSVGREKISLDCYQSRLDKTLELKDRITWALIKNKVFTTRDIWLVTARFDQKDAPRIRTEILPWLSTDRREALKKSFETNEEYVRINSQGIEVREKARPVTDKELCEQYLDYWKEFTQEQGLDSLDSKEPQAKHWIRQRDWAKLEAQKEKVNKLWEKELVWNWKTSADFNRETKITEPAHQALLAEFQRFSSLDFDVSAIFKPWPKEFSTSCRSEIQREWIEQTAPYSQRGVLKVRGLKPHDVAQKFRELGLIKDDHYTSDLETLKKRDQQNEESEHKLEYGRALYKHQDYLDKKNHLDLEDNMIIHGMSGCPDSSAALGRLEKIILTGGLKSLEERRRMGIQVDSLSPRGDIVSGLDVGVPCKIGSSTRYGRYIFFGLDPRAIYRRDIWFAPTDFGPGFNRYDSYGDYARSLGCKSMHDYPGHQARKEHIAQAICSEDNEIWFRHEIPWREINTLWIQQDIFESAQAMIEKYRHQLPDSLVIQAYQEVDELQPLLSARAKKINRLLI
jgi:hypothetical protein